MTDKEEILLRVYDKISENIFSIQNYSLTEDEIEMVIIETAKYIKYRDRLKGDIFYG
jgi:uncharacterized membrane protein